MCLPRPPLSLTTDLQASLLVSLHWAPWITTSDQPILHFSAKLVTELCGACLTFTYITTNITALTPQMKLWLIGTLSTIVRSLKLSTLVLFSPGTLLMCLLLRKPSTRLVKALSFNVPFVMLGFQTILSWKVICWSITVSRQSTLANCVKQFS